MRRHALFIAIFVLAAASRFLVLVHSQTHVHSDEAIIGLMAKHIEEGRSHPFYMYGQFYNAGAAWEAYLAALPFALFGAGVIPLKGCIVCLSRACLVVFYRVTRGCYGERTALLATLAFVLSPSLFKWHFQVRGYSWYFLSLPVLTGLFLWIEAAPAPRARRLFLFGLASGLSVWSLELVLAPLAAMWILLALGRKLCARSAAAGIAGFFLGYAPVIAFNLTHEFQNWIRVFEKSGSDQWPALFHPATLAAILFDEMPKFFGHDTVLWYYPERPAAGYVCYAIAIAAIGIAAWPFLKAPSKIGPALRGASGDENRDLLMLVLTAACFVPYLIAPVRVASYFLGGCVFLSILTGRLLARSFAAPAMLPRLLGTVVLSALVLVGVGGVVETGRRNEIETLSLNQAGTFRLARIPGADLDAVEAHLRRSDVPGVWTTLSFVYPLRFESHEKLAASDAIFGFDHRIYPEEVPWDQPRADQRAVFVLETDSPFRAPLVARCEKATHTAPRITEYGTLTVIEEKRSP